MNIAKSMTELIGKTPLIQFNKITNAGNAQIAGKLEFFNPAGSVKDRIGVSMVLTAERDGKIKTGDTLVESTSGNTGIALAWAAAARGYKLVLTMPESMTIERRKILSFFGAEIILTSAEEGMTGAVNKAKEIVAERDRAFLLQQFENPANPKIHKETTAEEIWSDTGGQVDIFVAGIGTGGTITGVSEVLKSRKASVKSIGVEPSESAVLSGCRPGPHMIQGVGAGFVPKVLNRDVLDEVVQVTSSEAFNMARRLAKEEGIFAGISSGAAVAAAVRVAQRPENSEKMIVVILPDTAERYISTILFEYLKMKKNYKK
ncbi:MAG: cysteine synthase A [Planctomycetota bacterium]|jgi:cysteine synthase A